MKASELVLKLQELIKTEGDLPVRILRPFDEEEDVGMVGHVASFVDENDKPIFIELMDLDTAREFS